MHHLRAVEALIGAGLANEAEVHIRVLLEYEILLRWVVDDELEAKESERRRERFRDAMAKSQLEDMADVNIDLDELDVGEEAGDFKRLHVGAMVKDDDSLAERFRWFNLYSKTVHPSFRTIGRYYTYDEGNDALIPRRAPETADPVGNFVIALGVACAIQECVASGIGATEVLDQIEAWVPLAVAAAQRATVSTTGRTSPDATNGDDGPGATIEGT